MTSPALFVCVRGPQATLAGTQDVLEGSGDLDLSTPLMEMGNLALNRGRWLDRRSWDILSGPEKVKTDILQQKCMDIDKRIRC